jgi:uncharacterized protein (TIGR00369 family)
MSNDVMTEAELRESFDRQGFNTTLGATLVYVKPGEVHVAVPFSEHLTQQNGFLHAGVVASVADNACGYAAMSAAPPGHNPLAVEFKVNLLAPAKGERFEARAKVMRRGGTLTVVRADVFAITGAAEEMVATMLETTIVRAASASARPRPSQRE